MTTDAVGRECSGRATDVPPHQFTATRITYFEAPGAPNGPARRQELDNPLAVTATVIGGSGSALAGTKLVLTTPATHFWRLPLGLAAGARRRPALRRWV